MRSGLALTVILSTLLLGAKSCGTEFTPKLIEDSVLLNKPGTRTSAFNQDMATTESTCFDQATSTTSHCTRVSAVIDPNNTIITKVVVQWGDRPGGNGEPWYDNVEPASLDFPNSPPTRPARWTARLPIRDNIVEGSVIDFQFRVFYKTTPEGTTEYSYWPGVRRLTVGPAQKFGVNVVFGKSSFEPTSLTIQAGQSESANIRLSRAPTAPVLVL
ncbi:MAG TPA: hypothetical protein DEP53_03210, partial [Bacteroidetes bacterium]|nr:hypothetical protein [Bacteroidota bacterium]